MWRSTFPACQPARRRAANGKEQACFEGLVADAGAEDAASAFSRIGAGGQGALPWPASPVAHRSAESERADGPPPHRPPLLVSLPQHPGARRAGKATRTGPAREPVDPSSTGGGGGGAAWIAVRDLNDDWLRQRCGGDVALMGDVLRALVAQAPGHMTRLRQEMAAGRVDGAAFSAVRRPTSPRGFVGSVGDVTRL